MHGILFYGLKTKKMNTMLDNLKKYFNENTIEQIQKDWDNTKVYDGIDSLKVGELGKLFSMHFVSDNEDFVEVELCACGELADYYYSGINYCESCIEKALSA